MVVYLSGQMRIFAHSPKQHTFSQCQGTPQDLGERVLDFERRDFLALLLNRDGNFELNGDRHIKMERCMPFIV